MSTHNELGVKGEILALEYLQEKGYVILEINWRFSRIEIDIIAKQYQTTVFFEVKTRSSEYFGFPENAVDSVKQKNMATAAEEYLEQHNIETDVRFDVISIIMKNNQPEIHHIQDAFFPYDIES